MYKYTLTKETPSDELGGYYVFREIETKDFRQLKRKLKELNIDHILVKNINKEVKKAYQKFANEIKAQNLPEENMLPVIYSPFLYRKPLFDPENPPDELPFIEVEYYPVSEILSEIKRLTGKEVKLNNVMLTKLQINPENRHNRLMLKQYNNKKKNYDTIFAISLSDSNIDKVRKLLERLKALWGEYIE